MSAHDEHIRPMRDVEAKAKELSFENQWSKLPRRAKARYRLQAAAILAATPPQEGNTK